MARWVNHSGTAVNVPLIERDVGAGEEVDVPDDILLPEEYFRHADVRSTSNEDNTEDEASE